MAGLLGWRGVRSRSEVASGGMLESRVQGEPTYQGEAGSCLDSVGQARVEGN